MDAFKKGIEALPAKIPFIRKIEVGLNANPEEQFDIALYSEFDTMDDVRAYAAHPAHLAVAALLKDCKKAVRVWIMNAKPDQRSPCMLDAPFPYIGVLQKSLHPSGYMVIRS